MKWCSHRILWHVPFILLFFHLTWGYDDSKIEWLTSYEEGLKKAQEKNKPILIYIYDPNSSDCKKQEKLFKEARVINPLKEFICIKVDKTQDKETANKFDIKLLPYSAFLTSNNRPVKMVNGYLDGPAYVKNINDVLQKIATPKVVAPSKGVKINPAPIAPTNKKPISHSPVCPVACNTCDTAVDKALKYLVSKQKGDGSWERLEKSKPPNESAIDHIDVALSALSGLAILSEGSTPSKGRYKTQLSSCVNFLKKSVREDGSISETTNNDILYQIYANFQTPFAAIFLAEVYALEPSEELKGKLTKVARYIENSQEESSGGWGYSLDWKIRPRNDQWGRTLVAVTHCNLTALAVLRNAGIPVSDDILKRGVKYIKSCMNADGGFTYATTMQFGSYPGISAGALCVLLSVGETNDMAKSERYFRFTFDKIDDFGKWLYFSHFFTALTMWQMGKDSWDVYWIQHRDGLLQAQENDGSWKDPDELGGAIFATAISAVILQMHHRKLSILQGIRDKVMEKIAGVAVKAQKAEKYMAMPNKQSRIKVFEAKNTQDGFLYLVDLKVSIEQTVDDDSLAEIEKCLKRANALLADLTNGQMRLNLIKVYTNKQKWDEADVLFTSKTYYGVHGMTITGSEIQQGKEGKRIGEYIELPWVMQDSSKVRMPWNSETGARVLVHELGHYLFGLQDEYHQTTAEIYCSPCIMAGYLRITELCTSSNHEDKRYSDSCWSIAKSIYPRLTIPQVTDYGPWLVPVPEVVIRK